MKNLSDKVEECIRLLTETLKDIMPQIGGIVLQDYSKLNRGLMLSAEILNPNNDLCETCGEPYKLFADGFDGECPSCADNNLANILECGDDIVGWEHTFDMHFTLRSDDSKASDATGFMLRKAALQRIFDLSDEELEEAFGLVRSKPITEYQECHECT